ncbi:MAG TPA: methionyl-tRNA formyltransferase [Acidimicrobiales bacterium]|jgi:methionyl-tRNA formyltransferase|nr:methionyl-tRNA formyltransferase [Acidimicrobiales bacterium]
MRLAFLGTPGAAVPALRALVDARHDVALVITRPDRRRGRGAELSPSPVKAAAENLGLRVSHRLADLEDLDVERGVVVAYGAIIPAPLLQRVPMLNVHFSLLPRWRGAAPVERAILAGDEETGVTIISLEPTLDTGPVHLERRVRVDEKSADELTAELAVLGASALIEVLATPELLENARVQDGDVTYAEKLTKETFHLTSEMSAALARRTVRLGGAYLFVAGKRVGVVSAHEAPEPLAPGVMARRGGDVVVGLATGAVALDEIRPEGSKTMRASAWWSGRQYGDDTVEWS